MKYLRFILGWITESTARTVTGIFVLSILISLGTHLTKAASSYDVSNEVQMNLDVSINSTQTTGIVLSAPQLNGTSFTFATTTGGILRIRYGAYREDIYYTSATVNATTKKVTLVGVTRNICPQNARVIVSCGNGRNWGKGAIVELTVDARVLNLKSNVDRQNTFSASGAVAFTRSGSLALPTFATIADRNQQLGTSPGGPVRIGCTTASGLCYIYIGGTWTSLATDGTANATAAVAGKVEIFDFNELQNRTGTGATGALVVLTPQALVKNGTGSTSAGRIPQLNQNGVIGATLGGTGTGGRLGGSSGALLITRGTGAYKGIYPGAANNVVLSNGTEWTSAVIPQDVNVLTGSIAQSNTLSSGAFKRFTQTGSLTPTDINAAGRMVHVFAAGNIDWTSGSLGLQLIIGNQAVASCAVTPTVDGDWAIDFFVTIRTAGASGVAQGAAQGQVSDVGCADSRTTASFDTTVNKTVNILADVAAPTVPAIFMEQFIIWTENTH